MKKPRTEITNESAKFVLNVYRPNGADAQDPFFRQALEQAVRDPELGAWFKEQRSFDSLIAEKLGTVQPPVTLHAAILAGVENRPPAPRFKIRHLLTLAAVMILSAMMLIPWAIESGSSNRLVEQYEKVNLTMLNSTPLLKLDLVTTDFARTQEYLAEMKAPCIPDLPSPLLDLPTAGCKTFRWKGTEFSLTCFRLPSGEVLHVFVIDEKALRSIDVEHEFKDIDGWHVKCERRGGMLLMFVSRASVAEIKQYI
jgi:hypothetical protein